VCSSRIDHETGIVVITTPACWAEVGHRLFVLGSASSYGVEYADWIERLLSPHPPVSNGNAHHFGLDTAAAEQRLLEQLRSGELHPSLVEAPGTNGSGSRAIEHQRAASLRARA
jgi:hypothetical protein